MNNGTNGCIGILDTDAIEFRNYLDRILRLQTDIEVYVNIPSPTDIERAKEKSKPDPLQSILVPGRKKRRSWGKTIAQIWGRVRDVIYSCLERVIHVFCQ